MNHYFYVQCLVTQSSPTLCDPLDRSPPGTSVHGDSPGKNTGVSCHVLLQGIFPIQGLNPGLLHFRWIFYHLSYQGSSWILEWVAYPSSRRSCWSRNWTGISCIAGRFFTIWSTSEAQESLKDLSGAYLKLALVVKNPLPVEETEETRDLSLDREMPRKRAWQPTPVLLPGESPWTEEPGRLQSIGSRELDRTEVT